MAHKISDKGCTLAENICTVGLQNCCTSKVISSDYFTDNNSSARTMLLAL